LLSGDVSKLVIIFVFGLKIEFVRLSPGFCRL
jgi:hypothetical protein